MTYLKDFYPFHIDDSDTEYVISEMKYDDSDILLLDADSIAKRGRRFVFIFYQTSETAHVLCLKSGRIWPFNSNPLLWWENVRPYKYPCIALCAKKSLSIPATSLPLELIFSTAGDIVTA